LDRLALAEAVKAAKDKAGAAKAAGGEAEGAGLSACSPMGQDRLESRIIATS
jgi:hypothetical protein